MSDEAGKVSRLQPFGGRLGDGVKYTLLGAFKIIFNVFPTFFSTRSGRMARQTAAPSVPKNVFPCKEVPFWGLVDTLAFWEILWGKTPMFPLYKSRITRKRCEIGKKLL